MSEETADGLDRLLQFAAVTLAEIAVVVLLVYAGWKLVARYYASKPGRATRMQIIQSALVLLGLVVLLAILPIDNDRRGQLLSLLGILLSAAIALSSTTVLGNAMAGIMLRSIRAFKPGDFLQVDKHFGRVTEMDLFHVEIQTETSDLTTLSNIFMITHPYKVMRTTGTIISVDVSLGYDVPRRQVRERLLDAARRAELEDPFVQVGELGDYSVSYRVAGLLTDNSRLIAARSRLREMVLDALHEGDIEIVSPSFMNQRVLPSEQVFIPPIEPVAVEPEPDSVPDSVVFEKAAEAASVEAERSEHKELMDEIAALQEQFRAASPEEAEPLRERMEALTAQAEALAQAIEARTAQLKKPD